MEGRFKPRLSRMFRASFGSCRSRNIADFTENPIFVSQTRHDFHHPIEPLSPKVRTFPSSMCRTERMESSEDDDGLAIMEVFQRSKLTERSQCFVFDDVTKGRTCPPASPVSPLSSYYYYEKKGKKTKKQKKTTQKRLHFDSSSGETDSGWFSSGDETETFFSSKSFSSDSSEIYRRNERISRRKAAQVRRRRTALRRNSEMGNDQFVSEAKVQESFAVVKRSSDPYNDFRTSMVEMIIEKQIFGAKDLEKLLHCFLSLNSSHHHRVIVEVFCEIWDTLFSNWS